MLLRHYAFLHKGCPTMDSDKGIDQQITEIALANFIKKQIIDQQRRFNLCDDEIIEEKVSSELDENNCNIKTPTIESNPINTTDRDVKLLPESESNIGILPNREIDDDKYEMFRKWLKDSERATSTNLSYHQDDDHNLSSDDEEFVDSTELVDSNIQSNIAENKAVQLANSVQQIIENEKNPFLINEPNNENDEHIYEALAQMPIPILEASNFLLTSTTSISQNSMNLSRGSSKSDLTVDSRFSKRSANHNKGPAPSPPPPLPSQSIEQYLPLVIQSTPISTPTNDKKIEKDKKSKGLFSYIPHILKPASPAASVKNISKETDI